MFAGPFVLEQAERVAADGHFNEGGIDERDIAGLLGVLVDKSMLAAQGGRFRLLETLREFGREQLAARPDADAIRDAHVAVHAELSRAAARGLNGPHEGQWMARPHRELRRRARRPSRRRRGRRRRLRACAS